MRRPWILLGLVLVACGRGFPLDPVDDIPRVFIAPSLLPDALVDEPYRADLTASGAGPWSWTLEGALPPGLALTPNDATATIAGTPLLTGDFAFAVTLTGFGGATARVDYRIGVRQPERPLTIVTTQLPDAFVGVPYDVAVESDGGAPPYTWSLTMGVLPDGLQRVPDGPRARVVGTGGFPQSVVAWVTVEDVTGMRAERSFAVRVRGDEAPLAIRNARLPPAQVGENYETTVRGTGGVAPYRWTVSDGSLPPGLVLETSFTATDTLLRGRPTRAGDYAFVVQVFDDVGNTATMAFTLSVVEAVPLEIFTATLPDATLDEPYNAAAECTPGFGPYRWSISAGSLPPGVSLQIDNAALVRFWGVPTAGGTFSFTLQVEDGGGRVARRSLQIEVSTEPVLQIIDPPALPVAEIGLPYDVEITAANGAQPYTWAVSGALPPGMTIEAIGTPSTRISGVSSTLGTYTFDVLAIDRNARRATRRYTIEVLPSSEPLEIVTTSLPSGDPCRHYLAPLQARGGARTGYTWSVSQGSLPPGLALASSGPQGGISGVPSASGSYTFMVQLTDALGATVARTYTIVISADAAPRFGMIVGAVSSSGVVVPVDLCATTPSPRPSLTVGSGVGALRTQGSFGMSPGGDWFVYVEQRNGQYGIYAVDLTAATLTAQLVDSIQGGSVRVRWAPNGSRFAYFARANTAGGGFSIHAVDVLPSGLSSPRRLDPPSTPSQGPNNTMVWSSDGRRLAFTGDHNVASTTELWVSDVFTSSVATRAVSGSLMAGQDVLSTEPVWSPDANRLFFAGNLRGGRREIFHVDVRVVPAAPQPLVPMAPTFASLVLSMTPSPDGTRFVFVSDLLADNVAELFLVDMTAPSFTATRISPPSAATSQRTNGPVWSSASDRVLYTVQAPNASPPALFMNASAGAPVRLDPGPSSAGGSVRAFDTTYAFSPSGDRVTFLADLDVRFRFEPYVVDVSGPTPSSALLVGQHQAGANTRLVRWASAAERLFVVTEAPNSGPRELYAIDFTNGGAGVSTLVSGMGTNNVFFGETTVAISPSAGRAYFGLAPSFSNAVPHVSEVVGPNANMPVPLAAGSTVVQFYEMPW